MGCTDSKNKQTPVIQASVPSRRQAGTPAAPAQKGLAPSDKVTVEYFACPPGLGYARAGPIRFLLGHADKRFEMIEYTFEQWGPIKAGGKAGEFGGLPRVCINGEEFGQSMATLRMLGAMHGFYDATDWKTCSYVDTILDAWVDMHDKSYEVAMFMPTASAEERAAKMKEYIGKVHEPCLRAMEQFLGTHGGPYIAGPSVTIADLALVAFLVSMWEAEGGPFTALFKPVLAKYPKVQAYFLRLR